MSIAAAQAEKFYSQIVKEKRVFTFTNDGEYLVFPISGYEVVPFWSSLSRMKTTQKNHEKYQKHKITELSLTEFMEDIFELLEGEKIHIGINWSGKKLVGYDCTVSDVKKNLMYRLEAGKNG